jgi:acyl carrier protein
VPVYRLKCFQRGRLGSHVALECGIQADTQSEAIQLATDFPPLEWNACTHLVLYGETGLAIWRLNLGDGPAAQTIHPVNRFSQFDSLGDSCEFGFAQQEKGSVHPHLLRFSSFLGNAEERLSALIAALGDDFARIAEPAQLKLTIPEKEWGGGRKEYRIINRLYGWQIHTGLMVDSADEEEAQEKLHDFPATIVFLRDKFLRALAHGRQTWIWKSAPASSPDRVEALFNALQKHGPNRLLWVLPADPEHPPHTILKLHHGLFKAYIWKSPDPWAGDWSDTKAWSEFLDAVQPVITDGSDDQMSMAASQPAAHQHATVQLDQARALLEEVVSEQLDEPNIRLTDGMMPADIHGWDSLKHVHIILDVEQRLGHTFARDDLDDMQHIGDFVRLIATAMPGIDLALADPWETR